MNTNRRHLLHVLNAAALSTTALALPGHSLAAVTERSSPGRLAINAAPAI